MPCSSRTSTTTTSTSAHSTGCAPRPRSSPSARASFWSGAASTPSAGRAAEALRLLRPRVAVPIHWGAYSRLGMTRDPAVLREPAERFSRYAAELAPEVEVRVLAPGERLEVAPC